MGGQVDAEIADVPDEVDDVAGHASCAAIEAARLDSRRGRRSAGTRPSTGSRSRARAARQDVLRS
jgi:hypothetical protein